MAEEPNTKLALQRANKFLPKALLSNLELLESQINWPFEVFNLLLHTTFVLKFPVLKGLKADLALFKEPKNWPSGGCSQIFSLGLFKDPKQLFSFVCVGGCQEFFLQHDCLIKYKPSHCITTQCDITCSLHLLQQTSQ